MTKIKPKWGVSVYSDGIIGPVKFDLVSETSLIIEDEIDPLNMEHWVHTKEDAVWNPTMLFTCRDHAKLYAAGARQARRILIEAAEKFLTEKFDYQD